MTLGQLIQIFLGVDQRRSNTPPSGKQAGGDCPNGVGWFSFSVHPWQVLEETGQLREVKKIEQLSGFSGKEADAP